MLKKRLSYLLASIVTLTLLATPSTKASYSDTPAYREGSQLLSRLNVRPETSRAGYDRKLFKHWVDADSNGCDTRREVLKRESHTPLDSCRDNRGKWVSIYDGEVVTDASMLDIDHVVSLAEAWDSGANSWSSAKREKFANDLSMPWALVAVTRSSNRSKSDKDISTYLPKSASARCFLTLAVIIVKEKYSLTIDKKEHETLTKALTGCTKPVKEYSQIPTIEQGENDPRQEGGMSIPQVGKNNNDQTTPVDLYNCPDTHPVKGNVSTTKIYHTPSSPYYARTKPEICFISASSAEAGGFRAVRK
ncbi:MAG: DUF1524 domain-containing protein [Candidatus Paceibacterota bacterium]